MINIVYKKDIQQNEKDYKDIDFDEKTHSYTKDGIKYISVTTLIGLYKKEFKKEFWGVYTALKDANIKVKPEPELNIIYIEGTPYTIDKILKDPLYSLYYKKTINDWDILTEEACIKGSNTHNFLEDTINKSKKDYTGESNKLITWSAEKKSYSCVSDLDSTNLEEVHPFIYKRLKSYINTGAVIYAEKKVFLKDYNVAGMIDVPIIKGDRFVILDWKTNKEELHKTAGYYKKIQLGGKWIKSTEWIKTGEMLLYPINHLENSKFNIYALQLSLYAYILEQWGYTLVDNGLEIIHIRNNNNQLIKIPYLKNEVKLLLEHYKNNQQN